MAGSNYWERKAIMLCSIAQMKTISSKLRKNTPTDGADLPNDTKRVFRTD